MANSDRTTSPELLTFREEGVLHLSRAIGDEEITTLKHHFWQRIEERFGVVEGDRDTWFANPYNPAGDARARRLSGMNPIMDGLRSSNRLLPARAALQSTIDGLFGVDEWMPLDRWYSLLSFPGDQSEWSIPHDSWHNDEPIVVGDHQPWSIFAFVFLDHVDQETGPTLTITGSHRRGEVLASTMAEPNAREVRAFENVNSGLISKAEAVELLAVGQLFPALTASDDWFAALAEDGSPTDRPLRFLNEGTSYQGIQSRVVELAAGPGDVILLDPRCLHTFSANVSDRPRQVLRLDFRRTAP